jgi:glutathione S-transferase
MRVICEFQAYAEREASSITAAVFAKRPNLPAADLTAAMHAVASEARTIEGRLSKSNWIVGESFSAADMVIFPSIQLLVRALNRPESRDLSSRFLPLATNYPALERWIARVEALPGYERTYPPHWRDTYG